MAETKHKDQETEKEKIFWNGQVRDKYSAYEKGIYAAFRECEYQEIIAKGLAVFSYPKDAKVLDIGCGGGVSSIVLSNMGFNVQGMDISSTLIAQAVELSQDENVPWNIPSGTIIKRPSFVVGDAAKLSFADESFDICFSVALLHHFPDYSVVLREICRVLKPGGILIACEPNLCNPFYRLSFYLVNRKSGVTGNEFPLSPYHTVENVGRYFRNIALIPFRENDVPFLRQLGGFGKSPLIRVFGAAILFIKNIFCPHYWRGTFFILGGQK